jgi:hypothetical protein
MLQPDEVMDSGGPLRSLRSVAMVGDDCAARFLGLEQLHAHTRS